MAISPDFLLNEIELKTFHPKKEPVNFNDPQKEPINFSDIESEGENNPNLQSDEAQGTLNITAKEFLEAFQEYKEDNGRQFFKQDFICPITLTLMYDPVTISSGHTFNRSAIVRSDQEGNHYCPMSRKFITRSPSSEPTNLMIRNQIVEAIEYFQQDCRKLAAEANAEAEVGNIRKRLTEERQRYPDSCKNDDTAAKQYFINKYTALGAFKFELNETTINSIDAEAVTPLEAFCASAAPSQEREPRPFRDCLPNFFARYDNNPTYNPTAIETVCFAAPLMGMVATAGVAEVCKISLTSFLQVSMVLGIPALSLCFCSVLGVVGAAEFEYRRSSAQEGEPTINGDSTVPIMQEENEIQEEHEMNDENGAIDALLPSKPQALAMEEEESTNTNTNLSFSPRR